MTLPEARIVRSGIRLGAPPRTIPTLLWLRIVLGGMTPQILWWTLAIISIAFVVVESTDPEELGAAAFVIGMSFVVMLPIHGIFIRKRLREVFLLRHGIEARGTLVSSFASGSGKHMQWHYVFEYQTSDGTTQTTTVIAESPEDRLEDDPTETLVYDPTGTLPATPLDHLPGNPEITREGTLRARTPLPLMLLGLAGPPLLLATLAFHIYRWVTLT